MQHTLLDSQNLPDAPLAADLAILFWGGFPKKVAHSTWTGSNLSLVSVFVSPKSGVWSKVFFFSRALFSLLLRICCASVTWLFATLVPGSGELWDTERAGMGTARFLASMERGCFTLRDQAHGGIQSTHSFQHHFSHQELWMWVCDGRWRGRHGSSEYKWNSNKWTLTDRTTKIPIPFLWVSWKHQQINWSIIFVSSS